MTVAERTQQGRTGSTLIRDDIDGLRAISILAVVAYHAGLPILGGGFIGVDVFFVISGYLITAHLVKEWRSAGRIDLTAFWARRVRRLLPALFVVLLTVLALAPFVLARASGEVGALSRAALSAVALNANHFFLLQAGDYFGPVAETNPLLHLWSLSVEEQFYLVWPLALVLLLPRVRSIAGPIAMLALLSLCLALVMTPRMPAAAFFTMPPRAWELLAGALLAVIPLSWPGFKRLRPAMLVSSGFFLVVLAAVFINAGAWFPAPAGVLPVAGAVLILLGGSLDASNRASRLLGSGWMSYLGRVSYPWYLWHWPLLVFSRSRRLYESDPLMDVLMVVLSLVLAVATYEWLEKPMQRRLGISRRLLVKAAAASLGLAVIALALGMWVRYGWNYSPKERQLVQVRGDMPTDRCLFGTTVAMDSREARDCALVAGAPSRPRVFLLGDSHANHWLPALERAVATQGGALGELAMRRCAPLAQDFPERHCVDFNRDVRQYLGGLNARGMLAGIVVSARWPEATGAIVPSVADSAANQGHWYSEPGAVSDDQKRERFAWAFKDLLDWSASQQIPMVVVMPSPVLRFATPHCLALRPASGCGISRAATDVYMHASESVIRALAPGYRNVRLLDPKAFMCNDVACPAAIEGTVAYSDDDHVTKTFSTMSAKYFVDDVRWMYRVHAAPEPLAR